MAGAAIRTDDELARIREQLWQLRLERIREDEMPSLDAVAPAGEEGEVTHPVPDPPGGVASRSRFRPARRAGSALATALLAVVAASALFVAYGSLADNRWYTIVAIEGGSMEPTVSTGDAVVVTRPPRRVEEGMIVVLQVQDRLVTHRVVAVRRDGTFVTKGDANDFADDWSETDVRVAGVVRAQIPLLGRVLRAVGSGAWVNDRSEAPVTATGG